MLRTSGYHFPNLKSIILSQIILFIFLLQTGVTLKFQTSNLNAGRARLVLFQGRTRHEIIGRSCPVGVAFTSPQLFSCACVTGVWAFYDIMCAPPLQIIGGVNHCFKMPLSTYIQEAMLLSNPTRAHGESLTAFNGDMESLQNKFYRETHSRLKTPSQLLTVGSTWTLKNPTGGKEICLDSSKNKLFEESDTSPSSSLTSAYCTFTNASRAIPNIGSVSVGCKEDLVKVEPQYCYPFLDSNSEEICNDLALLEAYEMAVEQENNDLTGRRNITREFKRLVKNKKKKTTKTTISSSSSSKQTEKETPVTVKPTTTPVTHKDEKILSNNLDDDEASNLESSIKERGMNVNTLSKQQSGIPKYTINPILDNLLNDDSDSDSSDDDNGVKSRSAGDGFQSSDKDPTIRDDSTMKGIYESTVKNQGQFLVLSGSDSDKIILKHVWEYQQEQIRKALQLKTKPSDKPAPGKLQIREVFSKAVNVMTTTCQAVPQGYLQLAMDTFINIQEKEFRWHPPFFTDKELDGILLSLERCQNESQPYNFVKSREDGNESACARRNPEELIIGTKKGHLQISEKIKSDGYEPLVESLWKVAVHAITYCEPYLHSDFRASSKLNIAMTEIFRNQIHLIWFRKKSIDMEYGGVLGDTKIILKDLDLCLVAAKKLTRSITEFGRPEFVAPPGWLPADALGSINKTENDGGEVATERPRESRNINSNSKDTMNKISTSNLMMLEEPDEIASQIVLNSLTQIQQTSSSSSTLAPIPSVTSFKPKITSNVSPSKVSTKILHTTRAPQTVHSLNVTKNKVTLSPKSQPSSSTTTRSTSSSSSTTTTARSSSVSSSTKVPTKGLSIQTQLGSTVKPTSTVSMVTTNVVSVTTPTPSNFTSSESESGSESEEEENSSVSPGVTNSPVQRITSSPQLTGETKLRRKRRALNQADIGKDEENWRKQRSILSGMAICLKKFDEVKTHLGQECE